MNLSNQLPERIARIEASKSRIRTIWRQQTEKQKWLLGIGSLAVLGLVLLQGKKLTSPGIRYLRQMFSTFVLVSKFIASSGPQVGVDEK
jgi:hypothetical protein